MVRTTLVATHQGHLVRLGGEQRLAPSRDDGGSDRPARPTDNPAHTSPDQTPRKAGAVHVSRPPSTPVGPTHNHDRPSPPSAHPTDARRLARPPPGSALGELSPPWAPVLGTATAAPTNPPASPPSQTLRLHSPPRSAASSTTLQRPAAGSGNTGPSPPEEGLAGRPLPVAARPAHAGRHLHCMLKPGLQAAHAAMQPVPPRYASSPR